MEVEKKGTLSYTESNHKMGDKKRTKKALKENELSFYFSPCVPSIWDDRRAEVAASDWAIPHPEPTKPSLIPCSCAPPSDSA